MGRRSIAIPFLAALLLLLFEASAASAGLIAYRTRSGNRDVVMVMDDTGANPTEVWRSPKFGGAGDLAISPPGLDGTWIAIEVYEGLIKVRADSSGLIKVLCGDVRPQQWSPDGTEILVKTYGWPEDLGYLVLVPATFAVGTDCASPLVPIYEYELTEPGWVLEGSATWNDDGSQIAFFEIHSQTGDIRLVILEREATGWATTIFPTDVEYSGWYPWGLDWQRGGNLLAFATRMGVDPQGPVWLKWIDTVGHWGYLEEDGSRLEGSEPSWSPDGAQLMFTDSQGNLVKWNYPDGPGEVLGAGTQADWQRGPSPSTCASDTDCDDGNPCTRNYCQGSVCVTFANTDPCDDGNPCTYDDFCDARHCRGKPLDDAWDPNCSGWCCDGECSVDANSCEPEPVNCSPLFPKRSCNADPACRWDNRNKVCVPT